MPIVLAVLACTLAGWVAEASGGNSLTGQTGLIQVPTAASMPPGTLAVGYGRLGDDMVFLDYGFGSQLELTIRLEGLGEGSELVPAMKYVVVGATPERGRPGVAVGLDSGSAYAVVSQYLPAYQVSVHGGLGTGRFGGLMLGLERSLPSGKGSRVPFYGDSSVFLEYVDSQLNLGARVFVAPGLSITVGVQDLSELACGVAYRLRL